MVDPVKITDGTKRKICGIRLFSESGEVIGRWERATIV